MLQAFISIKTEFTTRSKKKLHTFGAKYVITTSAPALLIDVNDSITAAFKSKAPAFAECVSMAYSPDTYQNYEI